MEKKHKNYHAFSIYIQLISNNNHQKNKTKIIRNLIGIISV